MMKYLKYKFKYLTEKTKIYGGSERCLTGEFNFCNNIPSIFKTDICLDQEGIITDHMPLISCINISINNSIKITSIFCLLVALIDSVSFLYESIFSLTDISCFSKSS